MIPIPDYGRWQEWLPALISVAVVSVVLLLVFLMMNSVAKKMIAADEKYLTLNYQRSRTKSQRQQDLSDHKFRVESIEHYQKFARGALTGIIILVLLDLLAAALILLAPPLVYIAVALVALITVASMVFIWHRPRYGEVALMKRSEMNQDSGESDDDKPTAGKGKK